MAEQHEKRGMYFSRKYAVFYCTLLLIAGSFYGGYYFGTIGKSNEGQNIKNQGGEIQNGDAPLPAYLQKDVDFSLFWEVWKRVKSDYFVKDTPDTKLFYGSLQGIVQSLDDPYSSFLVP